MTFHKYLLSLFFLMFAIVCVAQNSLERQLTSDLQPNANSKINNKSVFISEGFESIVFPPPGWQTINVTGSKQWNRVTTMAYGGQACAMIDYESTVGEDWLITPRFNVSSGDSLTFFLRLNYSGWIPDSLAIRVSTTDSLMPSFTNLLLFLADGLNYPAGGTWQKYSASLGAYAGQSIYIAFRHADANGDGIYLDDVFMGSVPPNDVMVSAVNISNSSVSLPQVPHATVYNNGTATQTFNVTMQIDGGYTSTKPVNALMPGASYTVAFNTWTPTTGGMKNVTVYTKLNPDAIMSNDTMRNIVFVQGVLENYGWMSKDAIPKALVGAGAACYRNLNSPSDTGYVFIVGGNDFTNNSTTVLRYNTLTSVWDSVAPVPIGRFLASAFVIKNKLYYIGGYNPANTPVNKTHIYDIATNTWSTGANMITAVGDYAAGVYKDSLIYIIGGWAGMADINNVQIYNTATNLWSSGSPKLGTAVDGLRGGLAGNKIIIAGGHSQPLNSTIDNTYIGEIDSANPSTITWTDASAYPFGAVTRAAAGVPQITNNSMVMFNGGEINGAINDAYASTCAFDFNLNTWMLGPDKITPVNILCDFPGLVYNDSIYNVVVSGFTGTNKTTVNEWLNLGPSDITVSSPGVESPFKSIDLRQNYPNPFNSSTTIAYFVSKETSVVITIYDQFGRIVRIYQESNAVEGYHQINADLSSCAAGIYFYRMLTPEYSKTLKMIKQ